MADQPLALSPRHVQGTGPIEIYELVYSQTYNYPRLNNVVPFNSDRWFCDDLTIGADYYVTDIYVWVLYIGEHASNMNLVISEDDTNDSDPNTNIDVWSESVPCTNTFTGDSNWGYDIYKAHCFIDQDIYPMLYNGVHYYFEVNTDVINTCWITFSDNYYGDNCWYDDGSGVWVRSEIYFGLYTDMFFDFYGEPVNALEPETWGSIKTLF
jgi:hypothetical protein